MIPTTTIQTLTLWATTITVMVTEGMEDTWADMEDTMVGTIMRVMVVIITGVTVTMEEATEAITEAMVITEVEAMADIMEAMAVTTEDTNTGEQRWGPML